MKIKLTYENKKMVFTSREDFINFLKGVMKNG